MQLDDQAKKWAICCLIAGIMMGFMYGTIWFIPCLDRAIHTYLGLVGASGILFCGVLPWCKMMSTKKYINILNCGHPWIGLLSAWAIVLHTNFNILSYWNISKILYLNFLIVIFLGVISFCFRQLYILKKETKGSRRKEMAENIIGYGYLIPKLGHDLLHYTLYPLLLLHVYGYFNYGRFW